MRTRFTKAEDYVMNDWWLRNIHVRTPRHLRNVDEAAGIINWIDPNMPSPDMGRFVRSKAIMRGCGCDVLA